MMWSEGRAGLAGALRVLQGAATILVLSLAGPGSGLAQPAAATKAAPVGALQLERRVVATAADSRAEPSLLSLAGEWCAADRVIDRVMVEVSRCCSGASVD